MYVGDNEEYLPYSSWSSGTYDVANWLYTRKRGQNPEHDVTLGQLWSYIPTGQIYWCPLERTNTALFKQRDMQVSSYVMNGAVTAYGTSPNGKQWGSYKMDQFNANNLLTGKLMSVCHPTMTMWPAVRTKG
jgi:hypothetical protein